MRMLLSNNNASYLRFSERNYLVLEPAPARIKNRTFLLPADEARGTIKRMQAAKKMDATFAQCVKKNPDFNFEEDTR